MGNSGLQGWKWLVQVDSNGVPTGVRKPNDPSDPDYVAPVINYSACPIPATTTTTSTSTTTTSTSSTSTTTTTLNPAIQPLKINIVNQKAVTIAGVNNATASPVGTAYYTGSSFNLLTGTQVQTYSGLLADNSTILYLQNLSGASIGVNIWYSQDNGASFMNLGSYDLVNGATNTTTYATHSNTTGLTNILEIRIS